MQHKATYDPILERFRSVATELYGSRLERLVLFGSRARGDNRPDSDYDIAVFLHGYTSLWTELQPLGAISAAIAADSGEFISAKPFRAGRHREDHPLMREIARDGLDL